VSKFFHLSDQFPTPIDANMRSLQHKQWTRDILRLMVIVIGAAAVIISGGILTGTFLFQEAYPIYIALGLIFAAWWLDRCGKWGWASFIVIALCFSLGVYSSYFSGFSGSLILFYAIAVMLAGILRGIWPSWFVVLLSMAAMIVLGTRPDQPGIPGILAQLITVSTCLIGIALLIGYFDTRVWYLLAAQLHTNQLLVEEIERRQLAESTQREQEAQLRRLAENTTDLVAEINPTGSMVYVSPSYLTGLGYSPEMLVGTNAFDLVHPDDLPHVQTIAQQAALDHKPARFEVRCRHQLGHYIPFEISGRALFDQNEQIAGFVFSSRDIASQKQAELALRLSEEKFSTAFKTSPDSLNINRLSDGMYLDINQGFTRILGYTREDVAGKTSLELNIWADPADRARLVKGLTEKGEVDNLEAQFRKKDGGLIFGLMSARVIEIAGEKWLLSITRDITEREQAEQELRQTHAELEQAYEATLQGWARALELREKETAEHSRRVVDLTLRMGAALGFKNEELLHIRRGALLHDIGKMGIPDEILLKRGPLSQEEWPIMRNHPGLAYSLLSNINYLRPALDIPYAHHEHWDGSGYPRGLRGEEIPLAARIFTVVDVYDALISERPYRPSWPDGDALSYLIEQKGKLFDPHMVDLFLEIIHKNG
jgi:PAS domain S-box-containing protein